MTTVVSSNGDAYTSARAELAKVDGDDRAAAYAEFAADGGNWKIDRVAERLALGKRQAGTVRRQWIAKMGKEVAATPASVSGQIEVAPARGPGKRTATPPKTTPPKTKNQVLIWAARVLTSVVALVAATLSYSGLRQLAVEAGLGWHADILPLAVDGLVAVCLVVRVVLPADRLARAAMWLALVGSVAANAAVYGPWVLPLGEIAAVLAGFVPVTAAVCYALIGRMLR